MTRPVLLRVLDVARSALYPANLVGLLSGALLLLCLVLLPTPWNILAPLYLLVAIWTLIRPRVALYLLPISVPWGYLDDLGIIPQKLPISSADFLVAILFLAWLLSYAFHPLLASSRLGRAGLIDRESVRDLPFSLLLSMLLLVVIMTLSLLWAPDRSLGIKEITKWVEVLLVLLLSAQYLRTRRQIWTLVVIICLAAISQAFLGYAQSFLHLGPSSFIRSDSLRIYGTFGQPNPYAGYIDMALTITIALALLSRDVLIRILAGTATLLLGYAFVLTQSNGGQIGIAFALFFIVAVGFPRLRPLVYTAIILLLGLCAAYMGGALPTSLLAPISKLLKLVGLAPVSLAAPGDADFSVAERLAHWIAGIRMFQQHPFTGVGIGNYPAAYAQYHVTIFVNALGHAHNYYINIAAETGIFGLSAFLLFLIAVFTAGIHAYRKLNRRYPSYADRHIGRFQNVASLATIRRSNQSVVALSSDRALAIGLIASLISVCAHNLVDNLFVHSMTILFALLPILFIRLGKIAQTGSTEETKEIDRRSLSEGKIHDGRIHAH